MKFQLFVLISCLVVLSESGRWPQSENNWSYEPVPKPKKLCDCLPKATEIAITPFVTMNATVDFQFDCDANSVVKQISKHATTPHTLTCNGWRVGTIDFTLDAILPGGYGSQGAGNLSLTNHTTVMSFNNGNMMFQDCGVIAEGRCKGDIFWGISMYRANEQDGCCKNGVTGLTGVKRSIEIIGKCSSRCGLTKATWVLTKPLTNKG